MLIQFRVENHRSVRDEQILSLVSTSDKAGAHVLRVEGLSEGLVPVAAIYGANASGKSNVLSALDFLRDAVVDSQRKWEVEGTPQDPFRLSRKASEPSLYEADIVVDGVRFRYGFQLSATRIEEEWLFAWPHGRKAMWFEREGDRFEFGKTLHGENETIRGLTRPNSLFLSAAAQNNHTALLPIFRCFAAWQFSLPRGHASFSRLELLLGSIIAQRLDGPSGAADRDAIMQLLQGADTGIVDVRVESGSGIEIEHFAPKGNLRQVAVKHHGGLKSSSDFPNHWSFPTVFFRHRAVDEARAWLPLASESAGTIALLEMAPSILDTLRNGGLLCIDELEASLHPTLALNVVRLFNEPKHNPRHAQLVFATHDTNLLASIIGEPVLRRDQVWFTEKDEGGGTHLYPLTDFHPRKEENLERGYLQGRYGAVPFLGDLIGRTADVEPGSGGANADEPDDDEEP